MNNDVKAAVEKLREAFEFDRKRCGNDTAESLWRDELLILAHIDGEPARIAAACEEALDALSDIMTVVNGEESGGVGQVADATNAARAVLAKAGRR